MNNRQLASVFNDIADLLELKKDNPFKIRAYQRAAHTIDHLPREVEQMAEEGESLRAIPGVGEAIERKINELISTGRLEYYERLKGEFPPGITSLMTVPNVGPRRAVLFAGSLGIQTIEQLESALRDGRVASLPGLGEKTAANILHEVEALRRKDNRILIGEALPVVDDILAALGKMAGVRNLTPAGSIRRFRETVGDIDLMGTAENTASVIDAFVNLPLARQVISHGPTKASVLVPGGLQVDLRFVEHEAYGSLLQHFTGSKEHNVLMRELAVRQGLSLSEYGISVRETGELEKYGDEVAFYHRLGLAWIPPEMREAEGEIERAMAGTLPSLVKEGDILGDLHAHTDWSDGEATLEQMAGAAQARGYQYLAITDHSAGRGVAHGLDEGRLRRQIAEIREFNLKHSGIRLLTGCEVDIRADGSLDAPGELLADLDVVVASVHSGMSQPRERMTERVIRALENPHVDILGHPTARLIHQREPVQMDMEAVLKAAASRRKAVEINAMPSRLDLSDIHARRARELGVKLVVSTDAHSPAHLAFMRFGIGVARRAWCEAGDILNTRPLSEFLTSIGH